MARVESLPTMCLGHKVCTEVAPEVFTVDKWGCVEVIENEIGEDLVPKAREAVYRCPAKALLITAG